MIHFRRSSPEVRLEMTPLIDVVFLLLTFFIFSLVLMVRANLLDITLPRVQSGPAAVGQTVTLAIDRNNQLFIDGEPIQESALVETLKARLAERPDAKLVLAADRASSSGQLIHLADTLSQAGLGEFSIIGTGSPDHAP